MSSVILNPWFYAVAENDMTLCPNEREIQHRFCVHLFGCIRRHSFFYRSTVACYQSSNI